MRGQGRSLPMPPAYPFDAKVSCARLAVVQEVGVHPIGASFAPGSTGPGSREIVARPMRDRPGVGRDRRQLIDAGRFAVVQLPTVALP